MLITEQPADALGNVEPLYLLPFLRTCYCHHCSHPRCTSFRLVLIPKSRPLPYSLLARRKKCRPTTCGASARQRPPLPRPSAPAHRPASQPSQVVASSWLPLQLWQRQPSWSRASSRPRRGWTAPRRRSEAGGMIRELAALTGDL